MTREEAIDILNGMFCSLCSLQHPRRSHDENLTKLREIREEAYNMAIEALSEPDSIELKKAYSLVFQDLQKCNMFTGIYDAKNGSSIFMNGISTVMESIAYGVSEEAGDAFTDLFIDNMVRCEEKVRCEEMVKCEEEASAEPCDKDAIECRWCEFYERYVKLRLVDSLFDKSQITVEQWRKIRRDMGIIMERGDEE